MMEYYKTVKKNGEGEVAPQTNMKRYILSEKKYERYLRHEATC